MRMLNFNNCRLASNENRTVHSWMKDYRRSEPVACMAVTNIPYEFISQRVELGWKEIEFGLDHRLLGPKATIEKATEQLGGIEVPPKELVELASLGETE